MSVLRNELGFSEIECIVLEDRNGHGSVAETTTTNTAISRMVVGKKHRTGRDNPEK